MTGIRIGRHRVGDGRPVFVIAEAGSNHDRKFVQARRLIEIARQSGADAVKFQLFRADTLYAPTDPGYQTLKDCELPSPWIKRLAACAKKNKIILLITPFDKKSLNDLNAAGIPAFKWASSETTNLPLLKHAALKQKPMLVSTGMCDLADVAQAVDVIRRTGNQKIVLMHCTSLYPTQVSQIHLRAMNTLKETFKVPVGFSDHSMSLTIPAIAVARGACVIEKHFTLNRKLKGPDHAYALEPKELKRAIQIIRETEESLGNADKRFLHEERILSRRKSLYAKTGIQRGQIIREEALELKRPPVGLLPRDMKAVIGKKAARNIAAGKPITWSVL